MHIKKYQKDGVTLYKFQGYLGTNPVTGERVRVSRTGFKNPKECEVEFYRLKFDFEKGEITDNKKYTYQEIYDMWVESYRHSVKESTYNKTIQLFNYHILPVYGKKYINMITIADCQNAVNKWFKKLVNFRSVNSYSGLVFKHAMKLDIIKRDPTKLITFPVNNDLEDEEKPGNYFSREELVTFLSAPELANNPKWFTLFRVLAYSGIRKGELLALTWNDINFIDNTLTVNKTLALGVGNKIIIQSPKTKKGKRVIVLDPQTMEILKDWKKIQAKELLILGFNALNKEQLVFSNLKNQFITLPTIGHKLVKICQNNNLKIITTHGFRHTHCSLLFEAGATLKEVQDRLGHEDIKTTMNIYAHVSEKVKEETALKFANFVNF